MADDDHGDALDRLFHESDAAHVVSHEVEETQEYAMDDADELHDDIADILPDYDQFGFAIVDADTKADMNEYDKDENKQAWIAFKKVALPPCHSLHWEFKRITGTQYVVSAKYAPDETLHCTISRKRYHALIEDKSFDELSAKDKRAVFPYIVIGIQLGKTFDDKQAKPLHRTPSTHTAVTLMDDLDCLAQKHGMTVPELKSQIPHAAKTVENLDKMKMTKQDHKQLRKKCAKQFLQVIASEYFNQLLVDDERAKLLRSKKYGVRAAKEVMVQHAAQNPHVLHGALKKAFDDAMQTVKDTEKFEQEVFGEFYDTQSTRKRNSYSGQGGQPKKARSD